MVRRVGFGDGDGGGREGWRRATRRPRRTGARRWSDDEIDMQAKATAEEIDQLFPEKAARRITGFARVFISLFLLLWLGGWSAGILFALTSMLDEGATPGGVFLGFWLIFAVIGWLFAVRMLLRVIAGKPIRSGRKGRPAPGTQDPNRNVGGEDQR